MSRQTHLTIAFLTVASVAAGPFLYGPLVGESHHAQLSPEARLVAIRRAQVWMRTDVPSMNLKTGPKGPGAFAPDATVNCDYVEKKLNGRSPKFTCKLGPKDEVKVKYGKENGEVYGEVAATRLLWALGFGADRMYPVRVVCQQVRQDPAANSKSKPGEVHSIRRRLSENGKGQILETEPGSGWAWPELDLVEETAGGAPRSHRDALKLVAVFIQHTDSKPEQQRLMCLPGEHIAENGEPCLHPFMMINDLGLTFGHATQYNRNLVSSVNFEQWSRAKVWSDPKACIGDLTRSQTGTLGSSSYQRSRSQISRRSARPTHRRAAARSV